MLLVFINADIINNRIHAVGITYLLYFSFINSKMENINSETANAVINQDAFPVNILFIIEYMFSFPHIKALETAIMSENIKYGIIILLNIYTSLFRKQNDLLL